jgi:hypothetical protein
MSGRLCYRWLISVLLTLVSGCSTFAPISPHAARSQPEIEVHFGAPRRLVARSQAGEEVVRREVTRLVGRPLEMRGDTLVLEITRWQASDFANPFWNHESSPLVAALSVSDPYTEFGRRRFSRRRTAALVLSPFVIAFALFFLVCGVGECWN